MTSRKNSDENTVVLFSQNISPGYETNILSFSSDLNQASLFDPSNFGITSDNFELLWSSTGEVPTIEVINKSIGIAIRDRHKYVCRRNSLVDNRSCLNLVKAEL